MNYKYVAIIDSEFVRDAQVCSDGNYDDEDSWEDWGGSGDPQIFLGVYEGTEEQVKEIAAREASVSPEIVTLIQIGNQN